MGGMSLIGEPEFGGDDGQVSATPFHGFGVRNSEDVAGRSTRIEMPCPAFKEGFELEIDYLAALIRPVATQRCIVTWDFGRSRADVIKDDPERGRFGDLMQLRTCVGLNLGRARRGAGGRRGRFPASR